MKFYESLYILLNSYDTVVYLSEVMQDNGYHAIDPMDERMSEKSLFHFVSLFNHSILNICTFIEEYDGNFYSLSEDVYKERIVTIKKIAHPAMKKIKQWKDLKIFRNELIAHPWRDTKNNEFSYRKLFSYNTPRTYTDLQILRQYLRMIIALLEVEFKDEVCKIPEYIAAIHDKIYPPIQFDNIYSEMNECVFEINALCKQSGKTFMLSAEAFVG